MNLKNNNIGHEENIINISKFNVSNNAFCDIRHYWIVFCLLAISVVTQILSVSLFIFSKPISWFHFPVALLTTWLLVSYIGKKDLKRSSDKIKLLVKACATFIVAILFSCQLIDFSFDGQSYHIPAMIALASGWNPIQSAHLIDWNPIFVQESGTELYIDHYPYGAWILAATVYKFTGLIESGKVFNLIYLFALYLIAIDFLDRVSHVPKLIKYMLGGLISLNPVIICQLGSFYVDGQLAALLSMAIILSLEFVWFKNNRTAVLLGLVIISLINVKMTGLVYASIIGAATFLGLLALRQPPWRFIFVFSVAWLIAVLAVGFHPYVTNTIQHKTPFYPIGVDIKNPLDRQESRDFLEKNRVEKLLYSLAGEKSDALSMPELKSPFIFSKSNIWIFERTDISYGAFGPLFLLVGIELLIVGVIVLLIERKIDFFLVFGVVLLLTTMAPISEMWKARYAPQLWLLPIALIIALYNNNKLWVRIAALLGGLLLTLNIALISYVNLSKSISKSLDFSKSLALLKKSSNAEESLEIYFPSRIVTNRARLLDNGISFKRVNEPTCKNPINIGYPAELSMKVCKQITQ
jgi:hypothetical protein